MSISTLPASGRQSAARRSFFVCIYGIGSPYKRRGAGAARCALKGDLDARNQLVSRNVRLAGYWANRSLHLARPPLELDDLIQEGYDGLIEAASRFNPFRHKTRFITYASYWIRQRIQLALWNQNELVRLPAWISQDGRTAEFRIHTVSLAAPRGAGREWQSTRPPARARAQARATSSSRKAESTTAEPAHVVLCGSQIPRSRIKSPCSACRRLIERLRSKLNSEEGSRNV